MPSGFYITDAFLWLDSLLGYGLFVPDKDNSKQTLAAQDSKRLKKLMGSLRYLFRNSHLSFITSFSNVLFLKGGDSQKHRFERGNICIAFESTSCLILFVYRGIPRTVFPSTHTTYSICMYTVYCK